MTNILEKDNYKKVSLFVDIILYHKLENDLYMIVDLDRKYVETINLVHERIYHMLHKNILNSGIFLTLLEK